MNNEQATNSIKAIENTLINHFNSEFTEFAKKVLESPPTSVEEIEKISTECLIMSQLGRTLEKTIESLNKHKAGDLVL